jgi:hypothetical protein
MHRGRIFGAIRAAWLQPVDHLDTASNWRERQIDRPQAGKRTVPLPVIEVLRGVNGTQIYSDDSM